MRSAHLFCLSGSDPLHGGFNLNETSSSMTANVGSIHQTEVPARFSCHPISTLLSGRMFKPVRRRRAHFHAPRTSLELEVVLIRHLADRPPSEAHVSAGSCLNTLNKMADVAPRDGSEDRTSHFLASSCLLVSLCLSVHPQWEMWTQYKSLGCHCAAL